MRFLAPLLCLGLLTGCASNVSSLHSLSPSGDTFHGALAAEYRDFADSEAEQGRSASASHFASKGLDAYHERDVKPDALDASISGDAARELADARAELMRVLTPAVKEAAPQELARAQLLFDCWQQQEVSKVAADKALCQSGFGPTLNQLLEKAGPAVYNQAFRHSVTFAPNATALSADNMKNVKDVVHQLSVLGAGDYWVELRAYVGKKSSQRKLTETRLQAVKKALIKEGVSERMIRILREGGSRSVILSRDNIPMNTKVVTITITADTHGKGK